MPEITHTASGSPEASFVTRRGRLMVIEGPDCIGKTTIVQAIKDNWEELSNRPADSLVVAKEPGGTLLGDKLRELLLDIQDMEELYPTKAAEMCMFSAARCQLMTTVVGPALAVGKDVLLDRYWMSTFVYQAVDLMGGQVPAISWILQLARDLKWIQPNLILIGDAPPEVLVKRLAHRRDVNRLDPETEEQTTQIIYRYRGLLNHLSARGMNVFRFNAEPQFDEVWQQIKGRLEVELRTF